MAKKCDSKRAQPTTIGTGGPYKISKRGSIGKHLTFIWSQKCKEISSLASFYTQRHALGSGVRKRVVSKRVVLTDVLHCSAALARANCDIWFLPDSQNRNEGTKTGLFNTTAPFCFLFVPCFSSSPWQRPWRRQAKRSEPMLCKRWTAESAPRLVVVKWTCF